MLGGCGRVPVTTRPEYGPRSCERPHGGRGTARRRTRNSSHAGSRVLGDRGGAATVSLDVQIDAPDVARFYEDHLGYQRRALRMTKDLR